MLGIKILRWSGLDTNEQERVLQRPVFRNPGLGDSVAAILQRVREG